jgi:hypothetical protein
MDTDLFSVGSSYDDARVGLLLWRACPEKKRFVRLDAMFHHFVRY